MGYITVTEQAFLGIGISTWVELICLIITVIAGFAVMILFTKLGPAQGYLFAALGPSSERNVGIIFQNHTITIKKLKYFSGVFEKLGLTWVAKKPEHHLFGVCSAEMLADFWGLTLDPKVNIATLDFINIWNSNLQPDEIKAQYPELYMEHPWIPESHEREPITDFDSLYKVLEKAPSDASIRIKAFSYVPIYELQRYYPKNLTASDLTGYEEAMRKVAEEERMSAATSYLPLICLGAGLLLGVGIMYLT